jgi:transcriptional regulator with XRE-family HTH domain
VSIDNVNRTKHNWLCEPGELDAQGSSEREEVDTSPQEDAAISRRVKAARERLGWSREELAFHSGISWSGVVQVESGRRRNLRPRTLSALAAALGVTIEFLLHGGPMGAPMLDHRALLYGTEEEFVNTAGPFLAEGVENSEAVLAVTTSANIELLRTHLGAAARRVEFTESTPFLTTPDAVIDAFKAFSNAELEAGAPWVRILGEPIWRGRSKAEIRLWTRFESLFNLVFATWPMTVLCPYDTTSVGREIARQALVTHPHISGLAGAADSPNYVDPSGFVLDAGRGHGTRPR